MLSKDIKSYLDSLNEVELLFILNLRFGHKETIWEEYTKEEYDKHNPECSTFEEIMEWVFDSNTDVYKKEGYYLNEQPGIMWQINNFGKKPDGYKYYKKAGEKELLMLGSDMIEYLFSRKPSWLKKYLN